VLFIYLLCALYYDNVLAFFRAQVNEYSAETSLFDVAMYCAIRVLVVMLIFRFLSFGVLMFIFALGSVFFVVKCFFFTFASDRPIEYATIIMGFLSGAAEIVAWTCLYPASIPLLQKNQKSERGSRRRLRSDEESIPNVVQDKDVLHTPEQALLLQANDSDFDTADEFSEGDNFVPPPAELLKISQVDAHAYTEEEKELLDLLMPKFPMFRQEKIYKFMVARDFDYKRVDEMLSKHLKWRTEKNIDQLDLSKSAIPLRGFKCHVDTDGETGDSDIYRLFQYNGVACHRFAKNGQPLMFYRAGFSDAKRSIQTANLQIIEKTTIFVAEFIGRMLGAESEQVYGKEMSRVSVVVDLESLGLRQFYIPALSYFTHLIKLSEENYPETSGTIFIINAPPIFQAFWKFVSPTIPPKTMEKIFFLGANYKTTLLEYINAEDLPSCFGGLCTCRCFRGCCPYPVSEGYTDPNADSKGWKVKKFKGIDTFKLPIAIRKTDLEYQQLRTNLSSIPFKIEYETEKQSVSFGIYFQPDFQLDVNMATALAVLNPIKASNFNSSYEAKEPGTFWFVWENLNSPNVWHYNLTEIN